MGEEEPIQNKEIPIQNEPIPQVERMGEPKKLHAFVIDDDNVGNTLARLLNRQQKDFEFEYFESALDALEKLEELIKHPEQLPAIILLDFNLGMKIKGVGIGTGSDFIKYMNIFFHQLDSSKVRIPTIVGISTQVSDTPDKSGYKSGGTILKEAGAINNIPKDSIITDKKAKGSRKELLEILQNIKKEIIKQNEQ